MIIRCPECSTGFRLSDDRVRGEAIKVRCSNCEHIFKAGLIDGKPTLFDTSDERLPDDKQLAEHDDESDGEQSDGAEQVDAAAEQEDAAAEQEDGADDPEDIALEETVPPDDVDRPVEDEGDSEYDPFPHAGSEAQAETSGAISGDDSGAEESDPAESPEPAAGADESAAAAAEQGSEPSISDTADMEEQPSSAPSSSDSEGAVSVHPEHSGEAPEFEGEETAVAELERAAEDDGEQSSEEVDPDSGASSGTSATEAAPTTATPEVQEPTVETDLSEADLPQDDDSIRAQEKHGAPDEQAAAQSGRQDESAEQSAATESGAGGAPPGAGSGPTNGPPPGASRPPADTSGADTAGVDGSSPGGPSDTAATSQSSSAPPGADIDAAEPGLAESSSPPGAGGDLALDGVDRVEAQSLGSGWFQTVTNIGAVLLLLAAVFVGIAAAQNGGLFDFGDLRQMAQVAFTGADYNPPDRFIKEVPKPVEPPEPENPVEFKDVFVQRIPLEDEGRGDDGSTEVLVLKGKAENVSDGELLGVKIRGIIYDESGKVAVYSDSGKRAQETAPLGVDLAPADISSAGSVNKVFSKVSSSEPAKLPSDASRPFTIVFESVPSVVEEGANVDYRVEVAEKYSPDDSE